MRGGIKLNVGDYVRIIDTLEIPFYNGRIGKVRSIRGNNIFGTWGGFPIIAGEDKFEVLELDSQEKLKLELEMQIAEHEQVLESLKKELERVEKDETKSFDT